MKISKFELLLLMGLVLVVTLYLSKHEPELWRLFGEVFFDYAKKMIGFLKALFIKALGMVSE